jgi:methanethiol S-methyltransferase
MKYFLITILWIVYCVIHSYLISIGFTRLMNRLLKKYYSFYRLFYVTFSLVSLIPLIDYTAHLDADIIIIYGLPLTVLRYVLISISLLMFFRAFFFDYDSLSFFGIRQILNFFTPKEVIQSGGIKRNGLLGIMRHPMYLALIIYLWCQTFTLAEIIVNLILTIYVVIGTKLEENKLVLEFGDDYIKYQSQVPMLIPFTKKGKKLTDL